VLKSCSGSHQGDNQCIQAKTIIGISQQYLAPEWEAMSMSYVWKRFTKLVPAMLTTRIGLGRGSALLGTPNPASDEIGMPIFSGFVGNSKNA